MFKFLMGLLLILNITACDKIIIPQTGNQVQVVSYSQLIDLTNDVTATCKARLIEKELCVEFYDKLTTAKDLIKSEGSTDTVANIFNYIRSKI